MTGFAGIYLPLLSGASEGIFMFEPEMTIIHSPKVGGLAAERGTYKKRIRRTKAKKLPVVFTKQLGYWRTRVLVAVALLSLHNSMGME